MADLVSKLMARCVALALHDGDGTDLGESLQQAFVSLDTYISSKYFDSAVREAELCQSQCV